MNVLTLHVPGAVPPDEHRSHAECVSGLSLQRLGPEHQEDAVHLVGEPVPEVPVEGVDPGEPPADGNPHEPLVVLMCGVAGSVKTTYAQHLEAQGYERLSIDEEVWRRFGRYGVDYDAGEYAALSGAAEDALRQRLVELIA